MAARANTRHPFLSIAPRSLSRVVLTCEHATNRLPFRGGVGVDQRRVLAMHWGLDIGAWALTLELAKRLGAGAIGGRWSRLLIDLNRRVDDETLLRTSAEGVAIPWNVGLSPRAVEQRIAEYHTPYHVEVDRLVTRRLIRGIAPLLFSVHSFTDRYAGRERPFDVGVLYERDRALAFRLGRSIRDAGLRLRYNEPYSGMAGMMYSIDRHGLHHRLPCLELEINQALFDDPRAPARLGRVIAASLEQMATFPRTRRPAWSGRT